jgi:hypothetical protein
MMWRMAPRAALTWLLGLATLAGIAACEGVVSDLQPGRPDSGARSDAAVAAPALDAGPRADAAAAAGPDAAAPAGLDAAAPTTDAAIDESWRLPSGVSPPVLWFWRGIHQGNLGNWRTDASGRRCADADTTMWFKSPGNSACAGAPSCDPDHFGTPAAPCTGVDCCWRNWDDPRGPEYRVSEATGPVEIHNWGARDSSGAKVPDYGFEVTLCAAPGTVAKIDTCPHVDVHGCVQDAYPEILDQCAAVLLTVWPPPAGFPASAAGCYSTKNDVTITF